MISVASNGSDSTAVSLYVVTDPNGVMPQTISLQRWKEDSQGFYQVDGYVTVTGITQSTHQGFYTYNYGSDYLDLDSGNYRFIYQTCCWGLLNNATNSWFSDFVVATDYSHNGVWANNTPYMENPMWINMQKDSVNTMKPVWGIYNSFFSGDFLTSNIDSVNFYQTELYQNYSNGVFVPQTSQSPSNILANNDSITFVSSTLGSVGNGFQIDRYHNGQLVSVQRIQWTFRVVTSTIGIEENEIEKEVLGVWDWQGRYIQENMEGLSGDKLYLIRYSDGSYDKVFLMKQ
jgi:hypothetical protein